jgi:hypothetical protein
MGASYLNVSIKTIVQCVVIGYKVSHPYIYKSRLKENPKKKKRHPNITTFSLGGYIYQTNQPFFHTAHLIQHPPHAVFAGGGTATGCAGASGGGPLTGYCSTVPEALTLAIGWPQRVQLCRLSMQLSTTKGIQAQRMPVKQQSATPQPLYRWGLLVLELELELKIGELSCKGMEWMEIERGAYTAVFPAVDSVIVITR